MQNFEIGKIYTINDISVQAVENMHKGCCIRCSFYDGSIRKCPKDVIEVCCLQSYGNDIIFEECDPMVTETKEPKYTVREVIDAYNTALITSTDFDHIISKISDKLKQNSDPEYLTYLRLKEKFQK